ncbi:hypothetical protein AVEN_141844-1 [Araneus ventricosus]|uniref:Integrase zinc-binding domain-containing protein n=1 Tax=Araneus ventricosus TaxID=182803 RepID=A0A4Y2IIH4_ARAVE|nr:hypothetical protein AVEN_141844-1 [Araneus ventricosus]
MVVLIHEREKVLKKYHDASIAVYYGSDGTFNVTSSRYYWTGMMKFIFVYAKNCAECGKYRVENQKSSSFLQTHVYSQRFETLSIDLFGPLAGIKNHKKRIFIVEGCSTKRVELFALPNATVKGCV